MPYVNESKDDTISVPPEMGNVPAHMIQSTHTAAQYGYRSIGEEDAAYAATTKSNRQWADTISTIAAYDRLERATSNPVVRGTGLVAHERRYSEQRTQSAMPIVSTKVVWNRPGYPSTTNYVDGQLCLRADITSMDLPISDSAIRSQGGSMLRESRPTKSHANLGQWFGELHEFGGMFNVPRELPGELQKYSGTKLNELRRFREGGRAVGSGYLAGQFGWLPFVGEVINSLDSIANSTGIVDDFVRNSAKLIKRSNRKELGVSVDTAQGSFQVGSGSSSFTRAGVGFNLYKGTSQSFYGFNSKLYVDYNATVTQRSQLRTSAIFEYFASDPQGFLGTANSYAQKAKILLGDPLVSLGTFWELAPWSWAIDWHFNLGSLLSYQESVATDGLVMHRGSTVYENVAQVIVHWTPRLDYYAPDPYYKSTLDSVSGNLISTATKRTQVRLTSSPYDMGVNWSGYSARQWFILGSLGLAKAPGVQPT